MRGEGRFGHHGRFGGMRRRRLFDAGELRHVLLSLIAEEPRHGYDLMRELEGRTNGAYTPSPGVVYPTLTMLLDMGLIAESAGEDASRKKFAITETGRAHLTEHKDEVDACFARLEAVAEMRGRVDAAPVRRAMDNLKTALQNRLSEDGVKKETILEVARLIDEAAGKIERL